MFTVCPKCALTLLVTTADLRVAQGYVRCGRCSSVFNALARLTEERPPEDAAGEPETPAPELTPTRESPPASTSPEAAPAPSQPAAPQDATSTAVPEEEAIPEDALEFNPAVTDVSVVFVEPPPNPEWTAATGSFKAMIAASQEVAGQAAAGQDAKPEPPARPLAPASSGVTESLAPPASAEPALPEPAPEEEPEEQPMEERAAHWLERVPRGAWSALAALAVLALLAQIVHHHREEWAATARFNRPLTALYAALGLTLAPRWDLQAYEVRQLGAAADPGGGGRITVRASIKNAAPQPQPLPLLRVTLQDRFGTPLASSDVAPRFYLPRTLHTASLLSPGQRIDAEMAFVDPGTNAVGFEIDACLPSRGGGVRCANDAVAR